MPQYRVRCRFYRADRPDSNDARRQEYTRELHSGHAQDSGNAVGERPHVPDKPFPVERLLVVNGAEFSHYLILWGL